MHYVSFWRRNVAPRSRLYKTFYLFTPVALRTNMTFLYHAQRRATVGRTPLVEWSARGRVLYLTTQNTHKRHIHFPGGIRTHNPSKREAAHPRLRLRGQHYRQDVLLLVWIGNKWPFVWHIPLLCVQWKTRGDGQRNCPKHVEFYSKNKFEKLVHLVILL